MINIATLSRGDAEYYAKRLNKIERRVVFLCSKGRSYGYTGIAKRLNLRYEDIQSAADTLKGISLVEIAPVRLANRYDGSAIFLNERGDQVRQAIISLFAWTRKAKLDL